MGHKRLCPHFALCIQWDMEAFAQFCLNCTKGKTNSSKLQAEVSEKFGPFKKMKLGVKSPL